MNTQPGQSRLFYVGTYVADGSPSIFLCRLDLNSGKMERVDAFLGGVNPSFLALHPNGQHLYAVNELPTHEDPAEGTVRAFAIDRATGRLTLLNEQPSHGVDPCHIITDQSGRYVLVANYTSGSLAVYPIERDGWLGPASDVVQHCGSGPDPKRQTGPHAHSANMDPANRFALVCDLGLDKVLVYRLDLGTGKLQPHGDARLHAGAGPRHLDFHPNGRHVYVINELDSMLTVFACDADKGVLKEIQTVPALPDGYVGKSFCAEVAVHPSGRFVYASNRGHDSLAIYAVDATSGRLTLRGHEPTRGKNPRHFAIDPSGAFLLVANQDGNAVESFRIDPQAGSLTWLHQIDVPKPPCVMFRVPTATRQ